MYVLRICLTFEQLDILQTIDCKLRATLAAIINTNLPYEAWDQTCLPVVKGGIGIRKAVDVAFVSLFSIYERLC